MTSGKEKMYERLKRECFWEYNFSDEDIDNLRFSKDIREKQFLFEKILSNSTDLLNDMELFDRKDLEELVEKYIVPKPILEIIHNYDNKHEQDSISHPNGTLHTIENFLKLNALAFLLNS